METAMITSSNNQQTSPNAQRKKTFSAFEFMKLKKFRMEKEEQERKLKIGIETILEELKRLKSKMIHIEKELHDLNFTKMSLRLHLRENYNNALKEKHDFLIENGMIYLIKAFWNINERPPIELFPKVLDEDSIKFLVDQSKASLDLENISKNLKEKQKEQMYYKINQQKSSDFNKSNSYLGKVAAEKYGYIKKLMTRTHKETARNDDFRKERKVF